LVEKYIKMEQEGQKELYANVVLTGGCCTIPGMAERLLKELKKQVPPDTIVNVTPPTQYAAWVGGSMAASLSSFQDTFITKADFEECGSSVIFKKLL